jgi:hypothetical protein
MLTKMPSSIQVICLLCSIKLQVPFSKYGDEIKRKLLYKQGNEIYTIRELTTASEAYNVSRCMNVQRKIVKCNANIYFSKPCTKRYGVQNADNCILFCCLHRFSTDSLMVFFCSCNLQLCTKCREVLKAFL